MGPDGMEIKDFTFAFIDENGEEHEISDVVNATLDIGKDIEVSDDLKAFQETFNNNIEFSANMELDKKASKKFKKMFKVRKLDVIRWLIKEIIRIMKY